MKLKKNVVGLLVAGIISTLAMTAFAAEGITTKLTSAVGPSGTKSEIRLEQEKPIDEEGPISVEAVPAMLPIN